MSNVFFTLTKGPEGLASQPEAATIVKANTYLVFQLDAATALNYMIPQGWGRIMAMSSVEGKMGKPAISSYVASKHAINGLCKSAAKEVGTMGITVNALCPGAIETDEMRTAGPAAAEAMGLTYEGLLEVFAQQSAIKRLNECEDVALVAVLLASDAGAGITGSMISIDGGTSPY